MKMSFASLASARAIATNCLPEIGKLVQPRAEVELHAELGERGARGLANGAIVHEPRRAHEAIERDVLGDRHFREKRQVLPNDRHALARGRVAGVGAATLSPK